MRLLIFSDLHGNQYAWRAFLSRIAETEYDRMVFLGDIFGYYYGQNEIMEGLSGRKDLIWLKGNHDQYFLDILENRADRQELASRYGSTYLRICPELVRMSGMLSRRSASCTFKADGLNILFCHGTPEDPSNGRHYPRDSWKPSFCRQYDTVICGHTHFRMARQENGKQWLNAGSLGQPRDGNESGFLLFDTETRQYNYVDILYDKAPLFEEIQDKDPELYKLKEILKRKKQ